MDSDALDARLELRISPKPSPWVCYWIGGNDGGFSYAIRPNAGDEPNWFWRKMQYLAFGFRWVRLAGEE